LVNSHFTTSPIRQFTNSPTVLLALTRAVPQSISRCELTHLARAPIDYARAASEHNAYEEALVSLGCRLHRLPDTPDLPDSVFVEDTAVVLDHVAIITRPGAESRRSETATVAAALQAFRPLRYIVAPGTLDGGDVLRVGSTLFVGTTPRTNIEGATQLAAAAARDGMTVRQADVSGCLHLKSAVTLVRSHPPAVLLNPEWVNPSLFEGSEILHVDALEPSAANALLVGETVLCATGYPRTRERLEKAGVRTMAVPAGELAKAEGGLTCGCVLVATR
jgi:dimethylargininase